MTGKEYGLMFLLNFATAILFSGVIIVGVFGRFFSFIAEAEKKKNGSPPFVTPTAYPLPVSSPPNTSAEGTEANPYQSTEAPMEIF